MEKIGKYTYAKMTIGTFAFGLILTYNIFNLMVMIDLIKINLSPINIGILGICIWLLYFPSIMAIFNLEKQIINIVETKTKEKYRKSNNRNLVVSVVLIGIIYILIYYSILSMPALDKWLLIKLLGVFSLLILILLNINNLSWLNKIEKLISEKSKGAV